MFVPLIKWTGSKRYIAQKIISFVDFNYDTYYEPFVGGGSVLYALNPNKAVCGDICGPLISLWNAIKTNPIPLAEYYCEKWIELQKNGQNIYYQIRDRFNQEQRPEDLLFLTRTCINGLIRFNSNGKFNTSFHHKRPGIRPDKLRNIILDWSYRIRNATFVHCDFQETLSKVTKNDLVYLDPPYFNTKGQYNYDKFSYDSLLNCLEELNRKQIRFMLSYDGIRNNTSYTVDLPKHLYKRHQYLIPGNSSYERLFNKNKHCIVKESLYLNW